MVFLDKKKFFSRAIFATTLCVAIHSSASTDSDGDGLSDAYELNPRFNYIDYDAATQGLNSWTVSNANTTNSFVRVLDWNSDVILDIEDNGGKNPIIYQAISDSNWQSVMFKEGGELQFSAYTDKKNGAFFALSKSGATKPTMGFNLKKSGNDLILTHQNGATYTLTGLGNEALHSFRMVINAGENGIGSIYVDGIPVAEDINLFASTRLYGGNGITFMSGSSRGTNRGIKLKDVALKYGKKIVTDPFKADTDNDGVNDKLEFDYGMSPVDPSDASLDFDGDYVSNGNEINAGTDPLVADNTVYQPNQLSSAFINNTDSHFLYSSAWTHKPNRNFGNVDNDTHVSLVPNETVEFEFDGSNKVAIISERHPNHGKAEVYVDDVKRGEIDLYAGARESMAEVFILSGYSAGPHKVRLVTLSNTYFQFDAIKVTAVNGLYVNSTDPANIYSGNWAVNKNRGYGDYENDLHYSLNDGAAVSISFVGTGIELVNELAKNHGPLDVVLDGVAKGAIDLKSSVRKGMQSAFYVDSLPYGQHQITLTRTTGYGVHDAYRVISGNPSDTPPDNDGDMLTDIVDADDDNDGALDLVDAFPFDPAETLDTDLDGIGNNVDPDDDNDGALDLVDAFPFDRTETLDTDLDGMGNNADPDDDNDGALDSVDAFPFDRTETLDTDLDGMGNNADPDDDNDGTLDVVDAFPFDAAETLDTDLDGVGNNADPDDDNDGTLDVVDAFPFDAAETLDTDLDGVGNNADPDDDNDGTLDVVDAFPFDSAETLDTDLDGIGNNADLDDDNDGVLDLVDAFPFDSAETLDTDLDGVGNNADPDDDNDGVLDSEDAFPLDPAETLDTDLDGIGNNADPDDDNDGILDVDEIPTLKQFISTTVTGKSVGLHWHLEHSSNQNILYAVMRNDVLVHQTRSSVFLDTDRTAETQYQYQLVMTNDRGDKKTSDIVTVSTLAEQPEAPEFSRSTYFFGLPASSQKTSQMIGSVEAATASSWRIVSGDHQSDYAIDPVTGVISLTSDLDLSTSRSDQLIVVVSDQNQKESAVTVSVALLDAQTSNQQGISQEVWLNQNGASISDIDKSVVPSSISTLSTAEAPRDTANNYGQHLRAYLRPKVSGSYEFFVASDDQSLVQLSKDMSEDNLATVAQLQGYTGYRNYGHSTGALSLEAGQLYLLDIQHKEGGGRDHLSVAWKGPEISTKTLISGDYLIPYFAVEGLPVVIAQAKQNDILSGQGDISLTFDVDETSADLSLIVYYDTEDHGDSVLGWSHSVVITSANAGEHSLLLEDLVAGETYYIRIATETVGGYQWSDVSQVETAEYDTTKALHQLPDNISVSVTVKSKVYDVELERYSVRMPNFDAYLYDHFNSGEKLTRLFPVPEVRTYRGSVENNNELVATGSVSTNGILYVRTFGDDQWSAEVDISGLLEEEANSLSLGNEVSIVVSDTDNLPEVIDGLYYKPPVGDGFHSNLVVINFLDKVFNVDAENPLDALAKGESIINQLDVIRGRDLGLRFRMAYGIIESPPLAADVKPNYFAGSVYKPTWSNSHLQFWKKGHCGGGGDFLGCWKGWNATGIYLHEVGHNYGLGHAMESDFSDHPQNFGTNMDEVSGRRTVKRLQKGSKFPVSEPFSHPMPPKAFKDYITVYPNEAATINPTTNDYDANGESLSLIGADLITRANGRVSTSGNQLTYTPPQEYQGVDVFNYSLSDGSYQTNKGAVEVQVVPNILAGHWSMDNLTSTQVNNEANAELYLTSLNVEDDLTSFVTEGVKGNALKRPLILRKWGKKETLGQDANGSPRQPHYYDPGSKSFTVSGWFRFGQLTGTQVLMDKGTYTGWQLKSIEGQLEARVFHNKMRQVVDFTKVNSHQNLTVGIWHHVAMVINRETGELRLYLDGELSNSQTLEENVAPIFSGAPMGAYSNKNAVLNIGKYITNDQDAVDEIKIFHRALSDTEIAELAK